MSESDFLNLLVTELKNQNPLDPLSGSEYAAQLAQFSSVEQLENLNTKMDSYLSATETINTSINNALAATFVGETVCAQTSTFTHTSSDSSSLGFQVDSAAESATVKIYNSSGTLVKTITTSGDAGYNDVTWDGTTDSGSTASSGTYTFTVSATDASGSALTATPYINGIVDSVRYTSSGTMFVIDGQEVSLSKILEISKE
jgi:flagellar basal-body rod modification protein FlgD